MQLSASDFKAFDIQKIMPITLAEELDCEFGAAHGRSDEIQTGVSKTKSDAKFKESAN